MGRTLGSLTSLVQKCLINCFHNLQTTGFVFQYSIYKILPNWVVYCMVHTKLTHYVLSNRVDDTIYSKIKVGRYSIIVFLQNMCIEYISKQDKQTSVPILKRKDGSANIRFRSIEHDFIAKPRGQTDPYNSINKITGWGKNLLMIKTLKKTR